MTGRIIEMTTRMVRTQTATTCLYMGIIAMILGVLIGVSIFVLKNRKWLAKKWFVLSIFLVVFGLCIALYGDSIPFQQQILACADGPVSLDVIASAYDIIDIDGSFIVMVRR